MGRRLGVLALWSVATFLAAAGQAQISPGPLVEAHAELDGSRDCLNCHAKGQGVDPAKCLACHQILAERILAGAGLHARSDYEDCRLCHIDHNGREYELVWWGEAGIESFDHGLTGEPLEGAHGKVACRDCHKADFIENPERLREAGKDLDRTLLGLPTDCAGCHQDQHRGQLAAAACSNCHSVAAWSPAAGFDHDAAAFTLAGAHSRVACVECHREQSDARGTFAQFKPVDHQRCTACHRDAHQGALGTDCESCHGTESWFATPGFDHSETRYPLTGRHRRVACRDCHRPAGGSLQFRDLPFSRCSDCHTDPHESRLGRECSSCHSTAAWQQITPERFDHQATRFALEGAHVRVDCAGCHRSGEPLAIEGFGTCSTCHTDVHLGQFARREDGGACEACHSLDSFKPTLFTEEEHQQSRFPLSGLHRGVVCSECHAATPFRPRGGGEVVQAAKFRYENLECAVCHEDPHAGTADRWFADGGCAVCHTDAGWKVPAFDHSTTAFALDGGHGGVACTACHPAVAGAPEERRLQLLDTPNECASCHQEPHGGQFADREGGCASCHTTVRWAELLFDHNRDSNYRLEGAHAAAPCTSCHLPEPGSRQSADPDKPVVRYAPLPSRCEDCHRG